MIPVRLVFRVWKGEYDPAEFSAASRVISETYNAYEVEEIGMFFPEEQRVTLLDHDVIKRVFDLVGYGEGLVRMEFLSGSEFAEYTGEDM